MDWFYDLFMNFLKSQSGSWIDSSKSSMEGQKVLWTKVLRVWNELRVNNRIFIFWMNQELNNIFI